MARPDPLKSGTKSAIFSVGRWAVGRTGSGRVWPGLAGSDRVWPGRVGPEQKREMRKPTPFPTRPGKKYAVRAHPSLRPFKNMILKIWDFFEQALPFSILIPSLWAEEETAHTDSMRGSRFQAREAQGRAQSGEKGE